MTASVLVTGANGFVGHALCSELARRGYGVRAAVRSQERGDGLPGDIVAIGDLSGDTNWSSAVDGVDAIVHLAARVHVMSETAADPMAEFRSHNVEATEALARAAAGHGVRRLVYVSSIKVNGEETPKAAYTPADAPRPRRILYGISKWEAEQSLWSIAAETGLEVVVVRPPLVYGPGVGGNFLRLLKLVRRGAPLPLGAVHNRRSMIYRGNLVSALIACAGDARAAGNTYLVSDGEDLSTPDLVSRLAESLGARARLWPVPPAALRLAGALTGKAAEVDRLIGSLTVDSSHIRTTLGWTPPHSVAEGLADTAQWFLSARAQP